MTRARSLRPARLLGLLAALAVAPVALAAPPIPSPPHAASVCDTPQAQRWGQNAVIYGVAPTLFGEPPLASVTQRLGALKALGVNGLWISPLFRTDDPSAISYSVTDSFAIRPDYGSAQDLHTLVREAHARGMKVLLDIVPNHTSSAHRFFRDAEAKGEASPYFHFYRWDAEGKARHYFNWAHLPNLNYQNPRVRKRITDAFTYWVRTFDVDGFRVDAAWGVRTRAPDFWPALRAALDGVKPGVFLLAEASAQDPYYVRHGFDAAYDWTTELGHAAWEKLFDDPEQTGALLGPALICAGTPMHQVARFLENNDTGARFITRHGEATTRMAAVLLATLPGIPVLFTDLLGGAPPSLPPGKGGEVTLAAPASHAFVLAPAEGS
jgi:glycosidase